MSKPREFWINEYSGTARIDEESINDGYFTHVIEYDAYEEALAKIEELTAELYECGCRPRRDSDETT